MNQPLPTRISTDTLQAVLRALGIHDETLQITLSPREVKVVELARDKEGRPQIVDDEVATKTTYIPVGDSKREQAPGFH